VAGALPAGRALFIAIPACTYGDKAATTGPTNNSDFLAEPGAMTMGPTSGLTTIAMLGLGGLMSRKRRQA